MVRARSRSFPRRAAGTAPRRRAASCQGVWGPAVPPDAAAAPPARPAGGGARPPSRNAVRSGVLAALSSAPVPAPPEPAAGAEAAAEPAADPAQHAPAQHAPPRGFGSLLRAAGRGGLRMARPLAAPILHRLQTRMRTAVNESDLAARTAGIEQALARLSERFDSEIADLKHEVADLKWSVVESARRLDIAASDNARTLAATRRDVASVSEAVRTARRPPVPVGGDFLVHTPDGVLLVPAEDLRLLAAIADGGVLEAGTRRVLAALLRPGGVFLDVGANVGTMTLFAARAVGPDGRIFAVEPTPRVAALLRRSMAANDVADRVAVADCAAGEQEGEALLHLQDAMSRTTLFPQGDGPEGRGTVRVRVRPADDLVPAGTPVDGAKIGAEGAEPQVWRGMRRILAESPNFAALLEVRPSHLARAGGAPEAWLREAEASGFAPYMIDGMTGVCRPAGLSALAGASSANILLLRPGAAARHPDLVFA